MLKVLVVMTIVSMCMSENIIGFSLGSQEDFYRVENEVMKQNMAVGVMKWPFTNCDSNKGVNVLYVQMADKPALGKGADISVVGKTTAAFSLKKVGIKVYYKGIFLIHVDGTGNFPIAYTVNRPFIYRYKVDIPKYAFNGHYKIDLSFTDDTDADVACVQIEMDL